MFLEDKELIYKKLTLREDKILFNLYLFSERVEKKLISGGSHKNGYYNKGGDMRYCYVVK